MPLSDKPDHTFYPHINNKVIDYTFYRFYNSYQYRKSHISFYKSKMWRNTRLSILSEHPLCYQCNLNNITTLAIDVDHVLLFRNEYDPLSVDTENLIPLCKKCHSKITRRESRWNLPLLKLYYECDVPLDRIKELKYISDKNISLDKLKVIYPCLR